MFRKMFKNKPNPQEAASRVWSQYQGMANSPHLLEEKAKNLSSFMIKLHFTAIELLENNARLFLGRSWTIDDEQKFELGFYLFCVSIHWSTKIGMIHLSEDESKVFSASLLEAVMDEYCRALFDEGDYNDACEDFGKRYAEVSNYCGSKDFEYEESLLLDDAEGASKIQELPDDVINKDGLIGRYTRVIGGILGISEGEFSRKHYEWILTMLLGFMWGLQVKKLIRGD